MEFHLNATRILKSAESLVGRTPGLLVCWRPAEWTTQRLLISGGARSSPEALARPQRQFAQKWGGRPILPGPRCLPRKLVSPSFNRVGRGLGRTFQLFQTIEQDAEIVQLLLILDSRETVISLPAKPGCVALDQRLKRCSLVP